jgi:hypothetical protein
MSGPFGAGGLNFFSGETVFYPYLLKRSLRFTDDVKSRMLFEPTTTGSNTDWTISFWIKRNTLGTLQDVIDVGAATDTNTDTIQFQTDNTIRIQNNGSAILHTNAKFRDTSAWYNIVVKSDADNGTAADKLKVYINGVDQDDSAAGGGGFSIDNRSGLSSWAEFGSSDLIQIGTRINTTANNLDAYLAEFHYVDGTALTASSFGETKQGIWIPKDYTGTHGTLGFYLNFTDETTVAGFSSVSYTGPIPASAPSGTTGTVTGVGFQPDLVWIKNRTNANNHQLFDSVRGIDSSGDQAIHSNLADAQSTSNTNGGVSSIDSDGFTVKAGTDSGSGRSNLTGSSDHNYVSWNWQAGGAPTATNSAGAGNTPTANSVKIDGSNLGSALAGTIPATKLSANTTYGFSIVTYTGTGSAGTIAHGLGAVPKWIMVKKTSGSQAWQVYHVGNTVDENGNTVSPEDEKLTLNTLAHTVTDSTTWNDTAPTSTVFSVGSGNGTNQSGQTYVAYLWCEKSGYSKFDSYTGNGSSSGPSVTTGFDVGYLLIKKSNASGTSWVVLDRARDADTIGTRPLFAGESAVEVFSPNVTFTSTGFQLATASTGSNSSGDHFIYSAFKNTRTNAFYLDQSGNGNSPTATGLEYRDSMPDLPTNNFCVVNSLSDVSDIVLTNGNLTLTSTTDSWPTVRGTMGVSSGKWYYEVISTDTTRWGAGWATSEFQTGSSFSNSISDAILGYSTDPLSVYDFGTARSINGSPAFSASTPQNNILQVAIDIDAGKFWLGINNTYVNNSSGSAGNPSAGTNELETFTAGTEMFPAFINNSGNLTINFGQDSTFSNLRTAGGNADANGNGDFFYAPPTGFLALCSDNLPDPNVDPNHGDNPEDYFNTVLYTGDGGTRNITGVGFQPDWVWFKSRSAARFHVLNDSVRGVKKNIYSNSTSAEQEFTGGLTAFNSDGYTIVHDSNINSINESGASIVAWNWKAGGTAVSNTDGTITTTVSASTEAGFSVFTYTGTGNADSVGHGLGTTPKLVIYKNRDSSSGWLVLTTAIDGTTDYLSLNATDTKTNLDTYSMTSSVVNFDGASTAVNKSNDGHVAFAFADIEGYSRISSYQGNGSASGPFVYTGFRPAFLMIKRTDVSSDWVMVDTARDPINDFANFLYPNLSQAEDTDVATDYFDALSNGFKLRNTWTAINASNGTYIFMAFAEQPFKYSNAR